MKLLILSIVALVISVVSLAITIVNIRQDQIINEYKQDCKPMFEDNITYLQCDTRSIN